MMRIPLLKVMTAAVMFCTGGIAMAESARIDLLMIYTPAARDKVGGTEAAKAKIKGMVDYANYLYARSDAGIYVNLLDSREVNYMESGDGSKDLARIVKRGDGYLDEVTDWRDQLGADVVGMMANGAGGVGIGVSPDSDPENAFVFWFGAPIDTLDGGAMKIMAHELGHVLGAGHHLDNPYNTGAWEYSHGQVSIGQNSAYSDIMVSGGGLPPGVTGYPPRYDGMSNPNVYYDGVPTGTPEGMARAADNARTLRQKGRLVAAYREAKSALPVVTKTSIQLDRAVAPFIGNKGGVTFFAAVKSNGSPTLQWQWSDNQGQTWSNVVESVNSIGSTSATLSIVNPDPATIGRQFRLLATDATGVTVSDVATLLMGATVTARQEITELSAYINFWQEIIPKTSFIQAIDIPITVTGNPPKVTAYLETIDGSIVAKTEFTVSSPILNLMKWQTLAFNAPVSPGASYRLRIVMPETNDPANDIKWLGSSIDVYAGRAKDGLPWDMAFRVYGNDAPVRNVTKQLGAGWHLLGNGSAASMQVATLFADANTFSAVRRWNASTGKWSLYIPGLTPSAMAKYAAANGSEVLSTIGAGEGYWVSVKGSTSLAMAPTQPMTVSNLSGLSKGWQMLSIGSALTPAAFVQKLKSENPAAATLQVDSVRAWDNIRGKWYYYSPALAERGGSVLADYATGNGMLDFAANNKLLEANTGIWVLLK